MGLASFSLPHLLALPATGSDFSAALPLLLAVHLDFDEAFLSLPLAAVLTLALAIAADEEEDEDVDEDPALYAKAEK